MGLAATAAQWARAEWNASKETELRLKVEALTSELLQLADEIRRLETTGPPKSVETFARKSADLAIAADARFGAAAEPRAPRGASGRLGRASAATVLRAEAEDRLRKLEQLSPGIASEYRQLLR